LFGLSRDGLRVGAVSENVADYIGQDALSLLGQPLAGLLEGASLQAVTETASLPPGSSVRLAPIKLTSAASLPLRTLIHSGTDELLLEAELPSQHAEMATFDLFARFERASSRLRAVGDVLTICRRLAEEVRSLTGYDRVKIYRFAPDWSGEVIAEDGNGVLPSYLGLHFPARDIPLQARLLHARNAERQIPTIAYRPVALHQTGTTPLDLSAVGLRGVSPCHIAYLRNMGVDASMSIAILRHGVLWGLVACHHGATHYVPPELRQASVLLAQFAAWQITHVEDADIVRRHIDVKAIEAVLLREASDGHDYRDALLRHSDLLLDLLQASGAALITTSGAVTTFGDTPDEPALRRLLAWLSSRGPDLFETDHLAAHYPEAADLPNAAGVLAVPLDGSPQNLIAWFRRELRHTITWGGHPAGGRLHINDADISGPRLSFAAWAEEVCGRSRPWASDEIAAAAGLRTMIVDIIARRAVELERMNLQLTRSNEDLEAFAYVAAHDLREPLRQIQTFGSLLERAFRRTATPPDNVARWFEGIQSSSRRLRSLINDLAEYSRLGRNAEPLAPVDLTLLLDQVLQDYAQRIEDLAAVIEADRLPILICDGLQMRQVLQNLISNALKYHHAERPPRVRITAVTAPLNGRPALRLAVADNGIGFDERHSDRIFDPFERLHSNDIYEGSGLGLAICRKVIERHGGQMTASSRLGEGSVFTVFVPLRPPVEHAPQPEAR